jgi:hypothetical protein
MKNPCIDCISLPICRAITKNFYDKECYEQIEISLKLVAKCPEVSKLIKMHQNIQIVEKIYLRNIYCE